MRDVPVAAENHLTAGLAEPPEVRQELAEGRRVVAESAEAIALAPYASRSPFETWVLPRRHQSRFEDAPSGEVAAVARLLRDVLRRMDAAL
jgi:UDPglucose--hexose-1-phosphate uridylyltransferase